MRLYYIPGICEYKGDLTSKILEKIAAENNTELVYLDIFNERNILGHHDFSCIVQELENNIVKNVTHEDVVLTHSFGFRAFSMIDIKNQNIPKLHISIDPSVLMSKIIEFSILKKDKDKILYSFNYQTTSFMGNEYYEGIKKIESSVSKIKIDYIIGCLKGGAKNSRNISIETKADYVEVDTPHNIEEYSHAEEIFKKIKARL